MLEENNDKTQTNKAQTDDVEKEYVETLLNVSKTSKVVNVSVATVILTWFGNLLSAKKGE